MNPERWPPFSKSRESFKYKANRHVISVASMVQRELSLARGAMARLLGPIVSYEILIERLIYDPGVCTFVLTEVPRNHEGDDLFRPL